MIGKPRDWKSIHSSLVLRRLAAGSWLDIKSKIAENAEEIFSEWEKKYPLEGRDVRNKYPLAQAVAKFAIMRELQSMSPDEDTLKEYMSAIDALSFNISNIFLPILEEKVAEAPAEADIPAPDTSALPQDIQEFINKAKQRREILKRLAGKTRRHKSDSAGDDMEPQIPEQQSDPAELVEKKQETTEEQPAADPEPRLDIIRRILQLHGKPGEEQELSILKNKLITLYASLGIFGRTAAPAATEEAPKPLLLTHSPEEEAGEKILTPSEWEEQKKTRRPALPNPEEPILMPGPPEEKESIMDRVPDAVGTAIQNLLLDNKSMDSFLRAARAAVANLREAGREVTADEVYQTASVQAVVNAVTDRSWGVFRDNGLQGQGAFLAPYADDQAFLSELEKEFKSLFVEYVKEYISNNIIKSDIAPQEGHSPIPQVTDVKELYRSLISAVNSTILPRWKREHEQEMKGFKMEALERALELKMSSGTKKVRLTSTATPDDEKLNAWTESILNFDYAGSAGMVMTMSQYIDRMAGWGIIPQNATEPIKAEISHYVKNLLEESWHEIFADVAAA